mgnify:CR=1 FL=1
MLTRWFALLALPLLIAQCCWALPFTQPLPVGSTAPDLTLPSVSGGDISLTCYRGRPVLLNFWSTT